MLKNQLLCCTAIAFLLAGEVTVNLNAGSGGKWLNINREALAKSSGGSGGRSSGGRSSSSSSSRSSSSSSSRSRSSNSPSDSSSSSSSSRPSNSGNTGGRVRSGSFEKPASPAPVAAPNAPIPQQSGNNRTVIIERTYNSGPSYVVPYNYGNNQPNTTYNQQPAVNPAPVTTEINSDSPPNAESSNDWKLFVFWLFVSAGTVALIAYCIYYYRNKAGDASKKPIFAVSKLQVAMLAEAGNVPTQLNELTLNSDLENAEDRAKFLQESVLIVLRNRESWTHVCATSQIFANLAEATQIFDQISIHERSKLSRETLSMVNGDIRRQPSVSAGDRDPGEYIAVTFLIGTEDTRPLFGDVRDVGKLKAVLERSAATPADNLLILEVIWSPQQETDSLTGDDLLGSYPDLIRIG